MRNEFSTPSSFRSITDLALGVFNGFPDRFCWEIKRSGERANECSAPCEVSSVELLDLSETLGDVLVPAATN